jgi:hypothetical protein
MFAALNSFLTRAVTGYFLNKSLRFRSSASAYLNRTPATATNQKTWTWSGWVKRGALADAQVFGADNGSSSFLLMQFNTDNLIVVAYGGSGNPLFGFNTSAVFRDPAAWYHVVLAFDTTQATAASRARFFINGVEQAVVTRGGYPSGTPALNTDYAVNGTVQHRLSSTVANASFFDGEMAEINFVDGQALAPTAFGASSIYNQWLPKKYAGTYGTNGFYLPFSGGTATSYAGSFNGSSQSLTVPDNAAFTLGTNDFTIECWINFSSLASQPIFTAQMNAAATVWSYYMVVLSTGQLNSVILDASSATQYTTSSAAGAILVNTWYHVAFVRNGNTNRQYINGVQAGTVSVTGITVRDSASLLGVGKGGEYAAGQLVTGYISNFRLVNGTCLYPSGTTFIPPTTALTAVTNTSLLTLQSATIVDNSTNAFTITNVGTVVTSVQSPFLNPTVLTADSSGNANNWTPNNISLTAGSTYDSLTDVPTLTSTTVANYAVLNPLSIRSGAPKSSDGNLTIAFGGTYPANTLATIGVSTGKWYWEVGFAGGTFSNNPQVGVAVTGWSNLNADPATTASPFSHIVGGNSSFWNNGTATANSVSYGPGDTVGVALNCDTNVVSFYKNNTLIGTAQSIESGQTWFPIHANSSFTALTQYVNFGQQPFVYTAPSGFLPLNTFNI